jgi:hypothetical protein
MYPPEPWDLQGQMYLSVFAVPRSALPPLPPPLAGAVRPVPIGKRALVGAAWVRYEPGGTLHYQELLSAVLVHEGGRPRVSITDIWVDSVDSRDGGRALWGIPKDLADLALRSTSDGGTSAEGRQGPVSFAAATISAGLRLPGRWPAGMTIAQALDGRVKRTAVTGRTGLRLGGATWRVDPDGPLGYLDGRRPLLSATLADFRLRFGAATPATAPQH